MQLMLFCHKKRLIYNQMLITKCEAVARKSLLYPDINRLVINQQEWGICDQISSYQPCGQVKPLLVNMSSDKIN